jgi:hypothetical protein
MKIKREDLEIQLKILRKRRDGLISAFCSEEGNLYYYIFKFASKKNSTEMGFAIEKYFLEWLHSHFDVEEEGLTENFIRPSILLCEKIIAKNTANKTDEISSSLSGLIIEKTKILAELTNLGQRHEEKLFKIKQINAKHEFLFNKLFESAAEGNS